MLLQQISNVLLLLLLEKRTGFDEIYLDAFQNLELQEYSNDVFHQSSSSWPKFDQRYWDVKGRVFFVPELGLGEEIDDPEPNCLTEFEATSPNI